MLILALPIGGAVLLGLSLLHAAMPKRFAWSEELARLRLLNRQIFWVHTFFIALAVALMRMLLFFPQTLLDRTPLARLVTIGLLLFWLARAVTQFFVYSRTLWRGKPFETLVIARAALAAVWLYQGL
ncbi:MAG: hypothetical protein NTV52_27315 [Acidobacteria bacterium]|nr:hypothetical protein [Acidobacteriota bacterium]